MKKYMIFPEVLASILIAFIIGTTSISAQFDSISLKLGDTYQTMEGFGASLAYYENWLTAHPKKAEIYDAIFGELSLDILRVRNAYDYDTGMIGRVVEFAQAAEASLGRPISILSSSWGPPGYLKSNNDRKNGGTLKFTRGDDGVAFDYAGFAHWWNGSLDEYSANGVFPDYISIQNEPGWAASWETCLLRPTETVNSTDTLAGYNKALDAVFDTLLQREEKPRILGPELSGIEYSYLADYVHALDASKLYGIAHHLYNGVDENYPWSSVNFTKAGQLHPEMPHFQTEYSMGDWFSLVGLIYKSLHDENAAAYLYWDLIWDGGGLVSLDFPWDSSRWTDPLKGYTKTKDFYTFKHFSGFIHPGWQRTGTEFTMIDDKVLAFVSPGKDTATVVIINRSQTDSLSVYIGIPGYAIDGSSIHTSSSGEDCIYAGELLDSALKMPPYSISTVEMMISKITTGNISLDPGPASDEISVGSLYPNPFSKAATLEFSLAGTQTIEICIMDMQGRPVYAQSLGTLPPGDHAITLGSKDLSEGLYFCRIGNASGLFKTVKLIVH